MWHFVGNSNFKSYFQQDKKGELTIGDILPLDCLPVWLVDVLELVVDVGLPCDVLGLDFDLGAFIVLQGERIVEETLGDKSTWEGSSLGVKRGDTVVSRNAAQLAVGLNGIAVVELSNGELGAHKLLVGARLDVTAMILVEVVELVVDIDRGGDVGVDIDADCARTADRATAVILVDDCLDALAHDVQGNAEGQEDETKDPKNDHGATKGGHRSPSGQHLLLELGLLKLFDLFLDADEIFFRDFHNCRFLV